MFTLAKTTTRLLAGVLVLAHVLGAGAVMAAAAEGTAQARTETDEPGSLLADHSPDDDVMIGSLDVGARVESGSGRRETGIISGGAAADAGPVGTSDFKAGPGCSIQCIISGVALARGVGATVVVETDTSARMWITVWNADGYFSMHETTPSQATLFSVTLYDLEPGTTYEALAVAEDADGYVSDAYGTFTTLNRHVEIELSTADVVEHGYGEHSFSKDVWVDGGFLPAFAANNLVLQGSTLDWGVNTIAVFDVDRHLDLAVQLIENDVSGDEPFCDALGPTGDLVNISGTCFIAGFATLVETDLDDRPDDATSATEHVLHRTLVMPGGNHLPPSYGQSLWFTVPVTLHVTYS